MYEESFNDKQDLKNIENNNVKKNRSSSFNNKKNYLSFIYNVNYCYFINNLFP